MSEHHVNEPEVLKENLPEGESTENTENAENATNAENESGSKAEKSRKNKKEKEKLTGWPRVIKEIREWVVSLVIAVIAVLIISKFILLPIRVDGASMSPTLSSGERLLVTVYDVKIADKLQKGDVVICNYPGRTNKDPILKLINMKTNFVKRIVGVPGDTVSRECGITYVNGDPLDPDLYKNYKAHPEYSYVLKSTYENTNAAGETEMRYIVERINHGNGSAAEYDLSLAEVQNRDLDYEYVLGEDEYFVVGDNRYNSHDSRDWNGPDIPLDLSNSSSDDVGPVTKDMIVGRSKFVFWPLGEMRKTETNPYYAYPGDPIPENISNNGGSDESKE